MTDRAVLTDLMNQLERIEASLPIPSSPRITDHRITVRAARRMNRSAGLLAASVLLDSAVEHYRGQFRNPAMFTPLVVGSLSLATSLHGLADKRPETHRLRHATYGLSAVTGIVGTGFHVYNVLKRPGGLDWQNLFYGAPLGAPFAILLSGLIGSTAEQVRNTQTGEVPTVFGGPAARIMALVTGLGLFGTSAEAALLHFRGAFHDPAMFAPVTIPPIGGALMLEAALGPSRQDRWFTRLWMKLTTALGFIGVGFHIWGVQRNMGGWRNWRQNLLNGPPIPAPPSFTALALAGLAALGLLEDNPDA
ncbi:MAG TPA: hypothetical protein PLD10_12510 [Rhodopila sp.]|nr:hypothetical protein [Rhodopila sp.]